MKTALNLGRSVMTSGFQQQLPIQNAFTRSAPEPQHGKKADMRALTAKELRSFAPPRPPAH